MKNNIPRLNGLQYEKFVAYQLSAQGFRNMRETPKTGDYGADLLCFDLCGRSCAVQCKYYHKKVGYKAVQEALSGAKYYNCSRAILVTNIGYTRNAKKGAKRLGVDLYICLIGYL